jgi:hypothetical protein
VPDLFYAEWSTDGRLGEVDLDDPALLHGSNPGLAFGRPSEEFCAVERAAMTDEEYARERLGIFPEHDGAPQWEVVTEEQWEACFAPVSKEDGAPPWLADPPTFAVEFTVDRSAASIGAAGRHPNGGVAVDVIDRRGGVDWVEQRLKELWLRHDPKGLLIDPRSPAGTMIRDLEAEGVTVTEVSSTEYARACGSMFDAIVTGDVHHHHQDELDAAVAWAKKRNYGEMWVLDRRGPVDVTPWAVVTLARWGHLEIADPPTVSVYERRGMEVVG